MCLITNRFICSCVRAVEGGSLRLSCMSCRMRVWCHASFRLQEQPVLTRSDVSAPLYSRRCHFTSRLLPLQYRLVLCSLFLNAPVDNCFHFSIPFHAISATSQKCFGGHGRSPLHSISDQVPFTCARSNNTMPRTAIAVVLSFLLLRGCV